VQKLITKSIPETTNSEPVLNICTTRQVSAGKFENNDITGHTYDEHHASGFETKKTVLRPSTNIDR